MRLHKSIHYFFLLSIEHLHFDAVFSVCFPEAKVIKEHFIEHFIFLQTSKNIRHTIVEVGINLGNFKLFYYYYQFYFNTLSNFKLLWWSHWSGGSVPVSVALLFVRATCTWCEGDWTDPNRTRIIWILILQMNSTL